nr:MAG TPA: hypothetical protein [Caudoviricetes sp.]
MLKFHSLDSTFSEVSTKSDNFFSDLLSSRPFFFAQDFQGISCPILSKVAFSFAESPFQPSICFSICSSFLRLSGDTLSIAFCTIV